MNIIKIRIANVLETADREIERTIDEMFHLINPKFSLHQNTWRPQIDIYENTEEIIILVDIACVKTENLHVEIDQRTVKIYGIRGMNAHVSGARYRLAEIPTGYFERSVNLPASIDTQHVEATYKEGLLHLTLAKRPMNKAHKIPINNI
jgi:HSP20 family protein